MRWQACAVAWVVASAGWAAFPARTWQLKSGVDIEASLVSQDGGSATLALAGGRSKTVAKAELGDEDLRYLANLALVKKPFRTWTWSARGLVGQRQERVEAALVDLTGFDSPLSKRHAVLVIRADGAKRAIALADLGEEDRAYVRTVESEFPDPPSPNDGDRYKIRWRQYSPERSPEPFNHRVTDHFVFYWGNQVRPEVRQWEDPAFREMNFRYFERVWNYFASIGATLPSFDQAEKFKTNVYITGTGLSVFPDGFAFGGEDIIISPAAMLEGSSVIPHEFGHTMQFASGAYRDSDYVGWFWENHGNWCSGSFIPGLASALDVYAERAHYELDSSRMNYGSWPFVAYFAEHPRFSPAIGFDVWRKAKRDARGRATETPIETFTRLAGGVQPFNALIGQMAAHNAEWDYVHQAGYLDTLRFLVTNGAAYRGRTKLRPVPDRPGWFRPLYTQTPRQYGFNVIDLTPLPGAKRVVAHLDGIVDETLGSNWRATWVAVSPEGRARYGRMWKTGPGSLDVRPNERLVLAIAATPDRPVRTEFRPGYNRQKRHFPYEVKFEGAVPAMTPMGLRTHDGVAGGPHPNGGGFVAATARVAPTAFVGTQAQVLERAQVSGSARIECRAVVAGEATVTGGVVGGFALVRGRAQVQDEARVSEYAVLEDRVVVRGRARVREFIHVRGNGVVEGDAMVKGFGDLNTGPDAPVGGGTIVGQDSEIHLGGWKQPILGGMLYGFMADDQLRSDIVDNRHLAARYDMKSPRRRILVDALGDHDGVLRGGAKFGTVAGRAALILDGKTGYAATEAAAVDADGITLDAWVRWDGGAPEQRILSFGRPGLSMWLTPSDAQGRLAFGVEARGVRRTVQAEKALPRGKWCRVAVSFDRSAIHVRVDGKPAASAQGTPTGPGEMRLDAGYLGRGVAAGGFFRGAIGEVSITRRTTP